MDPLRSYEQTTAIADPNRSQCSSRLSRNFGEPGLSLPIISGCHRRFHDLLLQATRAVYCSVLLAMNSNPIVLLENDLPVANIDPPLKLPPNFLE
ncbi:MAG: hypothetical protein M2R45_00459 [Verrucomicrobia subdivision 3 bacterium]|nr:hypothetical protein [Limisphaerales bacterium]MCS1413661.1 hypothetical protein [Limisphaerales bacterium]